MAEEDGYMKLVLSDPKTGKAYSKKVESADAFINKRLGDEIPLDAIGLPGYMARIAGGSDKGGFPMRRDLSGAMRKKILLLKKHGKRVRKSVRGNTVSADTSQLNLVITKQGQKGLGELVGKPVGEEKETEKERVTRELEAAKAEGNAPEKAKGEEGAEVTAEEKGAGKEKKDGGKEKTEKAGAVAEKKRGQGKGNNSQVKGEQFAKAERR